MKRSISTILLALVSAVASGAAIGAGAGSGDTQEIAAGVAVFAGLLAIATPHLMNSHINP